MPESTAQQPLVLGNVRMDVSAWEAQWKIIDANVSTSETRDTRYAYVRGDHELTARMPLGEPDALTLAGFDLGDIIPAIYCPHGPDLADLLENALVVSMPTTCDNTADVPRIVVTFKGGDLTRNVTYTPPSP